MQEYKPTLEIVKSKYYVCMTVPEEVRGVLGKQIRRSTGTSDESEAKKRLPKLAIELQEKINKVFESNEEDELREQLLSIAQKLKTQEAIEKIPNANKEELISVLKDLANQNPNQEHLGVFNIKRLIDGLPDKCIDISKEKLKVRNHEIKKAKSLRKKSVGTLIDTQFLIEEFIQEGKWRRNKAKQAAEAHLKRFHSVIGDKEMTAIIPRDFYRFAEILEEDYESSNSTIMNHVATIKSFFSHLVRKGYIDYSPAVNLSFKTYGKSASKRKPFTEELLFKLFAQDLPSDIRFLWSILITTGMRLDEAALLSRDSVKTERGIMYFDLTDAIVKNIGSARKVPIPNLLISYVNSFLVETNHNRFFSFPLNSDGKAQNAASKKSMRYIRNVTTDKAHVTHSFRHSFKDALRNQRVGQELNNFITGHSVGDVASNYGTGHSLELRKDALNSIPHPYLKEFD